MDRRQIPYTGTAEGEARFWRRFFVAVILVIMFTAFLVVFL
jgi:hypothetical protein